MDPNATQQDRSEFPPERIENNLLDNLLGVISDRTGEDLLSIAWQFADAYGEGDYGVAEDRIWDTIGPVIDEVQEQLGLGWN